MNVACRRRRGAPVGDGNRLRGADLVQRGYRLHVLARNKRCAQNPLGVLVTPVLCFRSSMQKRRLIGLSRKKACCQAFCAKASRFRVEEDAGSGILFSSSAAANIRLARLASPVCRQSDAPASRFRVGVCPGPTAFCRRRGGVALRLSAASLRRARLWLPPLVFSGRRLRPPHAPPVRRAWLTHRPVFSKQGGRFPLPVCAGTLMMPAGAQV